MEISNSLKLISLNVEGHKHLDLQMPFFHGEAPDVLCLQEVLESDFNLLTDKLGMNGTFVPMSLMRHIDGAGNEFLDPWGIGMLARSPLQNTKTYYYFGNPAVLHVIGHATPQDQIWKALLTGTVKTSRGREFTFGTTHFTWSKDGMADENQRRDLGELFQKLAATPEIVFCGDFNAPRGREIFALIAEKYTDCIPASYATSIDGNIHRCGPLPYMVDGLFTTPGYRATGVRLQNGVSDHCAIVAEVDIADK